MTQTRIIEDAFGKMVPVRPSYPTLDGMSFAEWEDKHKEDDEIGQVTEQVQQSYNQIQASYWKNYQPPPLPNQKKLDAAIEKARDLSSRGSFKVAFYCPCCKCTMSHDYCPDHGDIFTVPILVEK